MNKNVAFSTSDNLKKQKQKQNKKIMKIYKKF